MYKFLLLSTISLALVACERQDNTPATSDSNYSPDNTGRNAYNREEVTPSSQSDKSADLTITQKIRQVIIDDSSLSSNAKNVKIVTINGVVTLRGPVNSANEKQKIESFASKTSGVSDVKNELEVVPNKK